MSAAAFRRRFAWSAALIGVALAAPAPALAQAEDDVVINEFTVNPTAGKEYVELLVTRPGGVNMQGWTLSDVGPTGSPGATEGDLTLPATAAYLASVPQGTFVVVVLTTPTANANTLPEDTSTADGDRRLVLIAGSTPGLASAGTLDNATADNLQLYAGARGTGTLIDQVLVGGNTSLFPGAAWGDQSSATTTDNINGSASVPSNSAIRFVPSADTLAEFQANDTGSRFVVDASSYGTPGQRNTGVPSDTAVGGTAPVSPTGTGAADPASVEAGEESLLTVTVTPGTNPASTGIAVVADLTAIGGSGSQAFFDDGTNGDATAGDNVFSYLAMVSPATPAGSKTLPVTISDAEGRSSTASISLAVIEIVPIGVVQGAVPDSADGATHASPLVGQRVAVQGIVTERLRNAFFLQNTSAQDDDDPLTSDGIFVFTGAVPSVSVGAEVTVEGTVTEFFSLTELTSPVITPVDLGNALPAVFETSPPSDMEAAEDYWERREGMRARVPATSILLDGRDVFAGGDTEVWVARSDTQIALRADPFSRRSFRDPHPLDNLPALFDDGNGYRILLGGLWLRDNAGTMLAPTRTFQTLLNAPEGAVYFGFGKYSVQVTEQLVLADGVDPAANAPPSPPARPGEYSVATFNIENLYDFRDDPFDGCDFAGNRGCPGVSPPFDYVPASDAAYRTRLGEIAQQIATDLHAPELVLVQEAEDQDICTVSGAVLSCGATNNADGRPDTLQELALAIAARGGPAYQAALDRDGADDRGIVSGFLYRTDRVELVPASADDPVLGSSPRVSYRSAALAYNAHVQNPKALNAVLPADVDRTTGTDGSNVFTRPPQVGLFRIWLSVVGGEGGFSELYAVSNHFSSTPDARVGQRTEQARYNAAIAAALQAADAEERIVVGGDLNVFPRPDDPFFPGHPRYPSDQLAALYGQGLVNLYDTLVAEVPAAAYSYVFQGQAQTLDQQFVTQRLRSELRQVRMAHVNSDWPADHPGDGARGVSDHDQVVARFALVVEPRPPLLAPEFRPPRRLACRLGATPRSLRADRRARVTISLRAAGAPADEALVRLRGAGVRAQGRTDLRGIARLVVRPTRAGVIRALAPASSRLRGCSARIGVSAGRPAGRLTAGG
jgi:predicted extracellular nuclease